jgi:hypothetical protein
MKDSKKAKAQIASERQEGMGGEVNESEMCESERGESEKRDGIECDYVVSGGDEASGEGVTGGGAPRALDGRCPPLRPAGLRGAKTTRVA